MDAAHGARVVATQVYTLKTLTIRDDAFIAVLGGRKTLHAPHARLSADVQQGVMLARGTQWDVTNDPAGRREYAALAIAFPAELIRECHALEAAAGLPEVDAAQVLAVDEELLAAVQRTLPPVAARPLAGALLRHRVLEVLILLAQRGHRFAPAESLPWPERVRRLVAQRLHADWDVATLATAFHVSESTLRRRLEGCGTTLAALVRDIRLETALGLLQTTRLPVGEVAARCGWKSHSRFTVAFQERWGVPPSVVRARLKDDAQDLTETA